MTIRFLGVGGAFAPLSVGQSNMLIEENGKYLLFDCGATFPYIYRDEWKLDVGDIDSIYISHSHADHIASLEWIAFYRYFVPNKTGKTVRPKLYVASSLIESLWNHSLKGGLDALHGKVASITDYFECFPIQKNKHFIFEGVKFTPFQTLHVNCGFSMKYSYGLFIENPKTGKTAMISGDTCFNRDGLSYLYEKSDIIFHDLETLPTRSNVHASIHDMLGLPEEIRKKIWAYHYSEKKHEDQFAGFVEKGQTFII